MIHPETVKLSSYCLYDTPEQSRHNIGNQQAAKFEMIQNLGAILVVDSGNYGFISVMHNFVTLP